ncbi:MAG: CCA tRNA nucleotidyltransferase [Rhizobiaceae bacterium]
MSISISGPGWLEDKNLQSVLAILNCAGEEARIAGGAVRNALLGEDVSDIDIATTCVPEEVMRRAGAAGFKSVPTGIEHGTVTVIANGSPFEVTTLREDIETDGRRAKVKFGRSWQADAERRDFTINGLYADSDGEVVDLVGGVADIQQRMVRFIGDAETRIREDYLRILRFFRFFARYGDGRPDAEGLKACARLKSGLDGLSPERVWAELDKLLAATDPSRALLWMRQAGVLGKVLPETEKWGIDAIHGLVAAERALGWAPDALLRLEAIIPPNESRVRALADRLRLSNRDSGRLVSWVATPLPPDGISETAFLKQLYRCDLQAMLDRLKLALASARTRGQENDEALVEAGAYGKLLAIAERWQKPDFPLSGRDLLEQGFEPGEKLGAVLAQLETEWLESGFEPDKHTLIARAIELARADKD